MINQAFTQWSLDPVITTLETINAPIEDIQFPTVTVCDQKPADNWGPIEKFLNPLAFECYNPISNSCKESTKEIRKDFKFLIASIVEGYLELINGIDYKTLMEASRFKDEIDHYNQSGIIDIVAEILRQGKKEDLIVESIKQFATGNNVVPGPGMLPSSIITIKVIEDFFGANYTTDTFLNCSSEVCQEYQKDAVRILIMMSLTREGIPFGSFITQFIHLKNYKSFGSCRHDLCGYGDINIKCNILNEDEKILHEYFTILSKSFGFNDTELLSLYDLPGMLADKIDYYPTASVNTASVDGKIEADFLLGDIPQAYLYSDCEDRENFMFNINYSTNAALRNPGQFQQCYWNEIKMNETGMYKHIPIILLST